MPSNALSELENVMRSVFKRCLLCDTSQAPSCATLKCESHMVCVQTPKSCDACAFVSCMPRDVDPTMDNAANTTSTNVGAVAGGVVGGVAAIAIIIFLVWRFYLKPRRRQQNEGEWQEVNIATQEKADNDFVSRRSTRASTHTVASMASSVLTRASNIIQIAYIPGVTNRSGPTSPDLLVPPVPPIPAMSPSSGYSTPYAASEQHFFVPDFRDSMASGTTDGYSTYARTSIAPSLARTSVASTVYRQNAIVSPLPAQTIVRGKAAVVSVKSTGSNSPSGIETPPVPHIDPKHAVTPIRIQMPRMTSSTSISSGENSIRSTSTLGKVRALNITKKKASDLTLRNASSSAASTPDTMIQLRPFTEISISSTDDDVPHARARRTGNTDSDSESDDDDHYRARQSLLRASGSIHDSDITEIHDTPTSLQSPFSDSSASDYTRPDIPQRHTSSSSALRGGLPMTPIREESSKRTSHASNRTQSPFSDDYRSDI